MRRLFVKWMVSRGWVRRKWVTAGTVSTWRGRSHRETVRARQAEALLREGTALTRNDPNLQRWRARAIAQLTSVGRYDSDRAKPSDLPATPTKGVEDAD